MLRSIGLVALGVAIALAAVAFYDPPAFMAATSGARAALERKDPSRRGNDVSARRATERSRLPAVRRPDTSIETAALPRPKDRPQRDVKKAPRGADPVVLRPPADVNPRPGSKPDAVRPEAALPKAAQPILRSGLRFPICGEGPGSNCVIDGDTFVLDGKAIRVADIDTPESGAPKCAREAQLAKQATKRLQELLNAGPLELRALPRDEDVYGRKLRTVHRDGRSLGEVLIAEGLAHRWIGRKQSWCV